MNKTAKNRTQNICYYNFHKNLLLPENANICWVSGVGAWDATASPSNFCLDKFG